MNLQHYVDHSNRQDGKQQPCAKIVDLDKNGCPTALLDRRGHFDDAFGFRRTQMHDQCPMDRMREQVERMRLARPMVMGRRNSD